MTLQINSFEQYQQEYQRSVTEPEAFWADQAATFQWKKPCLKDNKVLIKSKSQIQNAGVPAFCIACCGGWRILEPV